MPKSRVHAALAASIGVEGPEDLANYLLAGADVVTTTSSLLRHGPEHAGVLLDGLSTRMARKGFDTVGDLRGKLAVPSGADETAHERAGYVAALQAANASAYGPWCRSGPRARPSSTARSELACLDEATERRGPGVARRARTWRRIG